MIHSFLLIGQSNMAGRGFLHEAPEINTERIKILKNGRWHPMFRPINPDRSFSGFNLAESFAEAYAAKYQVDVGLICCADGGTKLSQWQPGSLLYDHAVYQARLASRTSTIAGILWHQGEADCAPELYPTYAERFQFFMDSLRRDLNLYDVPLLMGGLSEFLYKRTVSPNLANHPHINAALQAVADANPMTGYVSAEGLKSNPDYLHFSSDALYQFGLRYFDVFETLRDPNKVFKEKPCADDALRSEMELL